MREAFLQVAEFEKACGHELSKEGPRQPESRTRELRYKLIEEEAGETLRALDLIFDGSPVADLAELADGLADLIWVCVGTAIHFGIDLPAVFEEVRKTNMSKFGPGSYVREDGKRMKPPGFVPPDIEGVLKGQRPLAETYGNSKPWRSTAS